jgi:hypothetical protein
LLFILAFIIWDIFKVVREGAWKSLYASIRPHLYDLLLLIVIVLPIIFTANQSSDRWNTAWFASAKYFPTDGKSLINASFIQTYNGEYTEITYGTADAKDFYFTNPEVFNGASTAVEAIKANPEFVIKQSREHVKSLMNGTMNLTSIPALWNLAARLFGFLPYRGWIISTLLTLLIIYAAIKQSINIKEWIFILACIIAVIPTVILNVAKERYLVPLIPALIVGGSWFCDVIDKYLKAGETKLKNLFTRPKQKLEYVYTLFRMPAWRGLIVGFVLLVLLSNGLGYWAVFGKNLVLDIKQRDIRVLDERGGMKQSFSEIESIITNCHGVTALESTYVGAFSKLPREKVYDVWEIPPFSSLNKSEYNGLRVERINCLLISKTLQHPSNKGGATNYGIRYQNYIQPYVDELLRMGASSIEIPGYGIAVIFKSPKN